MNIKLRESRRNGAVRVLALERWKQELKRFSNVPKDLAALRGFWKGGAGSRVMSRSEQPVQSDTDPLTG